ncbi:MAG: HtaA domain-containing protein, partial [Pseudolysinimonas sp.]
MRRALPALLLAVTLALAPAATSLAAESLVQGCVVSTAQLSWGFKESFRAYIDSTIANGEWTEADGATYADAT